MSRPVHLNETRPAWALAGAQTLRVTGSGQLRVLQGQVWLTVDGEAQDRVLAVGESLTLSRGHRLVVEAWSLRDGARLGWESSRAGAYGRAAPAAQHSSATALSCVRNGSQAASPR